MNKQTLLFFPFLVLSSCQNDKHQGSEVNAKNLYGAISYNPITGKSGLANGYTNKDSAVKWAKDECDSQENCKTRWVRNGCVILYVLKSNFASYYFASGLSLGTAENEFKAAIPENTFDNYKVKSYLCTL